MKSVVTVKLKIKSNPIIIKTMGVYSKTVSYISNKGFDCGVSRRYDLHRLCYYECKEKFKLPSQFIINANRIASQTLKAIKKSKGSKPIFKEYIPLDFDKRTFVFRFDNIRLTTMHGRINIPIDIPEYYWKYLDWSPQTAQIILKKDQLFIHIIFSKNKKIPLPSGKSVGIDLGIRTLAVTSEKKFFNIKQVKNKRIMFKRLRKKLQAKGTTSAKKLLKKISGREKRFMAWVNHNVSKQIVSSLKPGDVIIMEQLKGIRKSKGRRFNFWLHGWSFYQLQRFISYKAVLRGIGVSKINPFHTSKRCSKCGEIGSRSKGFFKCLHCGHSLNADLNASYNLAKHTSMSECVLAVVNQQHIHNDESKAGVPELRMN